MENSTYISSLLVIQIDQISSLVHFNRRTMCKCPEGYTGDHCETEVNLENTAQIEEECSLECQNGGICEFDWITVQRTQEQFDSTMKCTCSDGFEGYLCENVRTVSNEDNIDLQEACTKQCFNDGACAWHWISTTNSTDNFVKNMICECAEGFSGDHCEKISSDNSCVMDCHNGGTCVYRWQTSPRGTDSLVQNMGCKCAFGFTGPSCEIEVDESSESESRCSLKCRNGGECVFAWLDSNNQNYIRNVYSSSMMICECPAGYMGMHCEYTADLCQDGTLCLNGGACVKDSFKGGSFSCDCSDVSDTDGSLCLASSSPSICDDDVIGMNSSSFCLNGGKCDSIMVDGSASGRHGCRCPDGFGGDHCELNASSSMANSNNGHEDKMDSMGTKTVLVVAVMVGAAAIVSLIARVYYLTRNKSSIEVPPLPIGCVLQEDGSEIVSNKARLELQGLEQQSSSTSNEIL